MSVSQITTPPNAAFFGERLDADGHVYPEPDLMRDILGDLGRDPISDYIASYFDSDEDKASRVQNREDIWSVKGISALNGSKQFITSAQIAGVTIVFAVTDPARGKQGLTAFLVPAGTNGLLIDKVEHKMITVSATSGASSSILWVR